MIQNFKEWKILFLEDKKTLEEKGSKIISCEYQESLFSNYGFFSFQITFNGLLFSRFTPVEVYYDDELKMKGILKRPLITPFSKEMTIEIYPITYFLSIQGMHTDKTYEQNVFSTHILNVIKDNIDNSKIKSIGGYNGIAFDNFEFGIISPLRTNISVNNINDDLSDRKPKQSMKIFDYIEKLANINRVHITTLIWQNNTYLYFLDNASIINDIILKGQIPIITVEDLIDLKSFKLEMKEEKMFDEINLQSDGSFNDIDDIGTQIKYNIDFNKIFKKEIGNDTDTLKSFFKSSLNVKYRSTQKKESLMQQELMETTGKFIAENTLANGLVITVTTNKLKSQNNLDFLIGSYIDISDLFIQSKITSKKISAKSFCIFGKSFSWDLKGLKQDIFIGPSFLLENN